MAKHTITFKVETNINRTEIERAADDVRAYAEERFAKLEPVEMVLLPVADNTKLDDIRIS